MDGFAISAESGQSGSHSSVNQLLASPKQLPINPAQADGLTTTINSYYRRKLPNPPCVAFSSQEGKKLFADALNSDGLACYWKLAEQFHTQEEPAFCGLATLVMVLNALSIDPHRQWRGVWRWFSEDLLDCCVPLDKVKKIGITLPQFVCLARCQGVDVTVTYGDNMTVEQFREMVIQVASGDDDTFMVVSYSRKVVGQTGNGHFSPIGAYHRELDMVLIMDVARFKYPPHWLPLPLLFEAMQPKDADTGRSRGCVLLRQFASPGLLSLPSSDPSSSGAKHQLGVWWNRLRSVHPDYFTSDIALLEFIGSVPPSLSLIAPDSPSESSCEEVDELAQSLVLDIERTPAYPHIRAQLHDDSTQPPGPLLSKAHIVTMIWLALHNSGHRHQVSEAGCESAGNCRWIGLTPALLTKEVRHLQILLDSLADLVL